MVGSTCVLCCVVSRIRSAITHSRCIRFSRVKERVVMAVILVAAAGFHHMASREMLEDVVERLTEQLKVATSSLISTGEDFRQALEKLETMEKEHKRVVHEVGELKENEFKLIRERDEARRSR